MAGIYSVDVSADTTLVTTAETVVASLTGVSMARPGERVRLHGQAKITSGAAVTALTMRVRRDGLTGPLVGEADPVQLEVAAGSTEDHDIVVTDTPALELAGATYVLTAQQVGGAANATCLHASLEATVSP